MKKEENNKTESDVCLKCASPLSDIIETKSGRKLQRCSAGSWNQETKQVDGCDYVKWLPYEPKTLSEKCPKCGSPLVFVITRFGKRMKRCSTNVWDKETKTSTGCDYIEWVKGTTETLTEDCPKCGQKLVLYTSAAGKKMKKCSTNEWDPNSRSAIGCDYVEWLK
ncbi:hypothetical protein A3C23_03925 [Candidatus Roizmanbacteria bacterium RIFCSPHIGHO2_02_FULL_37_13b]|uniref:DNA topoisomerase type IA zn finger domain-containing protein n=1 Tax=Candidatus Roizmanbacteria bacterium RIFCSPLOWO2_02_FULL_36_11 TaxID=1802071 RepID=A0A1F7JC15_9BACT|nr:MAG: hypothetical protein A3C23_03925 [Candidatus Roizmanbacteria bacterium RIFCSPHIGHO2_02_FULL_37_13b]OGK53177.1 MAG: hypothetical protein A3H78_06225 [Candidatus Roizmanbacteria bacterium RIFCSPLOWO2_02_FULL_36_11]